MRCRDFLRLSTLPFVAAIIFSSTVAAQTITPVVNVESGKLSGIIHGNTETFFGIPYAAPPVGDLRWKEPAPPRPWQNILAADHFGPACRQTVNWIKEPQSEDCLFLNIWKPATPARDGKPYPVMVWFHGGGLFGGSGSQPGYDGTRLTQHGVILVTLNYRLGLFGFFSHPELTAESPHHASGNQGFQDQIAALHWIQHNISAFGGDPKRVTIFGESAGSASVNVLMNSPLTEGLFQRAIGESGSIWSHANLKTAEANGTKFTTDAGASGLKALRTQSADWLLRQPWQPDFTVDDYVYPADPAIVLATLRRKAVPLMAGWNADEGVDLAAEFAGKTSLTSDDYKKILAQMLPPGTPPEITARYPARTTEESRTAVFQFVTDGMGMGMWEWAQRQRMTAPAYLYHYVHAPVEPPGSCFYGCKAGHGAEIRFAFDQLDQENRPWSADDRMMADRLSRYWTNFAKTGNPNGEALPQWDPFDGTSATVQRLGTAQEITARGILPDFDLMLHSMRKH